MNRPGIEPRSPGPIMPMSGPHGAVLCPNQNRFSFSLKVSFT